MTPPGEVGRILSLQKRIGNQAVQRMLANSPEKVVSPPLTPIQHQATEEET